MINTYLIGIDCGATSTEVVIAEKSSNGNFLINKHKKLFDPVNLTLMGLESASVRISEIIQKSTRSKILNSTSCIVCGIAGARYAHDRNLLKKKISSILNFKNLHILPDTSVAFASIFNESDVRCGVLIAGSGSILYYRDRDGLVQRIGGWGRIAGDEGSGYWIGQKALSSITKCYDGRQTNSLLVNKIKKHFNIKKDNIIKIIYNDNFKIQKITNLVFSCAEQGDRTSINILKQAAIQLAEHFKPLRKKKIRIALVGSLFQKEKLLEKYLRQIVRNQYPNISILKTKTKPVYGALNIAKMLSRQN